ncbi:MAG TPA: phosphoenolpyruvate carboxykinase (ATP), partial [Ktedonobacter sp.]|nr:phosphoenolpyruvate carboxykinase (ATP) [Ktedonobacter sp.]
MTMMMSRKALEEYGLVNLGDINWNLSPPVLVEHALTRREGKLASNGAFAATTGSYTGRTPKDKFIVSDEENAAKIWWGEVNRPIALEHYDRLRTRLMAYLADRPVYAQDCFIGAHPAHRRSLRVYTETAWASIFARNLFRRPSAAELAEFAPNFTIIDAPSFQADPATEGTRTGTAILVNLAAMEIIIVGTEY